MSHATSQAAFDAVNANPAMATRSNDAMQAILSRSATDGAFRAKLLTNPKTALAELTGRAMPETLNVKFIEKQGDVTYVLPAAIDAASELSEQELESVAGGSPFLIPIAIASSCECIVSVVAISLAVSEWAVQG